MIRLPAAASGLALMLLATTVSADIVVESEYRKINNYGVGNCIWSSGHLYFQKDAEWQVTREFGTGNLPKEIRCFYPNRVMDYMDKGAFYNQLRDENQYYGYFTIEYPDDGPTHYEELSSFSMTSDTMGWDQGRIIASGEKCEFDDDSRNDGCVDVDLQAIEMAQKKGAAFPYTVELCYSRYFKWTDHYEERYDDFRGAWVKERANVAAHHMAAGCVTYTTDGSRAGEIGQGAKAEASSDKPGKKKKPVFPPPKIKLPF